MAAKNVWWKETFLQSWPWKQNATHSCGCCDNFRHCEQLKKRVTDTFWKKSLILNPNHLRLQEKYVTITIVTGVYMACIFHTNSRGKTSETEWLFESNLRSFGCFKCPAALWFSLIPSCKGNSLTRIGWTLQVQIITWRPK